MTEIYKIVSPIKMKFILLILLFSLTHCLGRISLTCLLLGHRGCGIKCNLKCLLLGCTSTESYCDGWSHCECNEFYDLGSEMLTTYDIENLGFNELWNSYFESGKPSTSIRKRIQKDANSENYFLQLLRNPYMSGDDIKILLKAKYPKLKNIDTLVSRQQSLKNQITEAGKPMKYDDLNANLDELLELINAAPIENINSSKYQKRVTKFLSKITDVQDLEELLHLVKLSGNDNLYELSKTVLRNRGYGFEEDGDTNEDDFIAILKDIVGGLGEANEEEILDVTVAKKFMPTKSPSSHITRVDNNKRRGANVYEPQRLSSRSEIATPLDNLNADMVATSISSNSHSSHYSNLQTPPSSNTLFPTDFNSYVHSMAYNNVESSNGYANGRGGALYYMVVDENGSVIQASGVPKKPISFDANIPYWNTSPPYYPPQYNPVQNE